MQPAFCSAVPWQLYVQAHSQATDGTQQTHLKSEKSKKRKPQHQQHKSTPRATLSITRGLAVAPGPSRTRRSHVCPFPTLCHTASHLSTSPSSLVRCHLTPPTRAGPCVVHSSFTRHHPVRHSSPRTMEMGSVSAFSGTQAHRSPAPLRQLLAEWKAVFLQLVGGTDTGRDTAPSHGPVANRRNREGTAATVDSTPPSLALLSALYHTNWPKGVLPVPVRLREKPCYSAVVAPLLVVLDLDHTVLRCHLSDLGALTEWSTSALRALFVDAAFLHHLCELLSRKGHHLAIASFTEGIDAVPGHLSGEATAADHVALTPPQVVVRLLDHALPLTRSYLTHPQQVVCMPASGSSLKLPHLRLLQQRLTQADDLPLTDPSLHRRRSGTGSVAHSVKEGVDVGFGLHTPRAESALNTTPSDSVTPSRHASSRQTHGCVSVDTPPRMNTSHRCAHPTAWVSTEVVLIDDNAENCWTAAEHGYNAFCCADGGLTFEWFTRHTTLMRLLGLTPEELHHIRGLQAPPTDWLPD